MKRIFTLVVAAMLAGQAWAATTFTVDGLKYTVTNVANKTVSVSIDENNAIATVVIPPTISYGNEGYTVTSIADYAFQGWSITSVVIPNTVTSIGNYAFDECMSLTSATIGSSVETIGDYAFSSCEELTSLSFGSSLTTIGKDAFFCSKLTEINVDNSNTTFATEDGVLFNKSMTTLILYPKGKIGDYTIPNGVTTIGINAFQQCQNLTAVNIPSGVTAIENYAFYLCRNLASANIPSTVASIGDKAFYKCTKLSFISIPNNVTIINYGVFHECGSLTIYCEAASKPDGWDDNWNPSNRPVIWQYNKYKYKVLSNTNHTVEITKYTGSGGDVTFPSTTVIDNVEYTVTSIGDEAIRDCSGLTSVTIPNSITNISRYAFLGCTGLVSVTLGNSVTSIGDDVFYNCSALTSVSIPNSVTSIGSAVFTKCNNLAEINVESDNTNYTSENGILFNKAKTKLICYPASKTGTYNIPNSVKSIDDYAFYNCSGLTSVTIPNSVTSIGADAFLGCSGLASVTIPNSVTSIDNVAFKGCSGLTSITIPNSVTTIGEEVFTGCSKLTDINVESANAKYTSENGVLFNKAKTKLICYPAGKTGAYDIPNSVTNIGWSAFEGCSGLTSVTIPNSVKIIDNEAFRYCSGLTSVTIPNSVKTISYSTFGDCSSLKTVIIGNSVTTIESTAFEYCTSLTSVTIPNSVTGIALFAFRGCSNMKTFAIPKSVTSIGMHVFDRSDKVTIYCEIEQSSKPSGWNTNWNSGNRPVKWGCKVIRVESNTGAAAIIDGTNYAVKGDDGSQWYLAGTENGTATLEATTISAHQFIKWSDEYEGETHEVNVTESKTYTAIFEAHTEVTLDAIPATCVATGLTEGKQCSVCNEILVEQKVVPISDSHNWGEPTYVWTGGSTCTATIICQLDANHKETENATITSAVTTAATCEDEGTTTYTAKFKNSKFSTQTKNIVNIAALGHNYGSPSYSWSADGKSCSARAVCSRNSSHTLTENATITSAETTAATCLEKGTTTYTAKFSNSKFKTQTKAVVDIAALGHNYGSPTYVWEDDGSACTATVICQHDVKHKETETATITSAVTIAATCEEEGTTTYTAKFKNNKFSIQTKDIVNIKALGHTEVTDVAVYATCTEVGLTEGKHCSVCNKVLVAQDTIPAKGHNVVIDEAVAATCTESGLTEGSHCSVCGEIIVMQEVIPAKGHKEVIDEAVAATTTSTGLTEGSHCSVCGKVFVEQTVIPKLDNGGGNQELPVENTKFTFSKTGNNTVEVTGYNGSNSTVVIPQTVTVDGVEYSVIAIADEAFQGNSNLVKVVIPNTIYTIGTDAFNKCENLEIVEIPSSVNSIKMDAFTECPKLRAINVDDENDAFVSIDGVLYDTDATILLQYPAGKSGTKFEIPSTVEVIGYKAFDNCTNLTSVTIPNSVSEIYWAAFLGCNKLETIVIPYSVTTIHSSAFGECTGLKEIYISESVEQIESGAFSGCTNATFYCESEVGDYGWDVDWCPIDAAVVWEYDMGDVHPAVSEVVASMLSIYAHGKSIIIENAEDEISVYDALGRLVCRDVPCCVSTINVNGTGIYIVKVGNVAKRVMVKD